MVNRSNTPNDNSSHDADERRELEELEQLARFLAERASVMLDAIWSSATTPERAGVRSRF